VRTNAVDDPNLEALAEGAKVDINVLFITNALEHKDIVSKLGDVSKTLGRIETHVEKTNGRVAALELWRWFITGAVIVLIPITIFLVNTALYNAGAIKKFEQMHVNELSTTPNSQEVRK
jgi:hypothetical protein